MAAPSKRLRFSRSDVLKQILESESDSDDENIDFSDSLNCKDHNKNSSGDEYDSEGDEATIAMNDSNILDRYDDSEGGEVGDDDRDPDYQFQSNTSDSSDDESVNNNPLQVQTVAQAHVATQNVMIPVAGPSTPSVRPRGRQRGRGHGAVRRAASPEWKWECVDQQAAFNPRNIAFTAQERVKPRMGSDPNVSDFFSLYINENFFNIMIEETNRFANQYRDLHQAEINNGTLKWTWKKVDMNEMKTFLGLLLLMGINHFPEINMYWSKDELYHSPIFGESMTRDRFKLIMRFWHFSNNDNYDANDPDRDRLYKVRRLIECLRKNCKNAYEPGRNICVDESLLLFKGRLLFRQCIKTKRARFGIKFYELCTSEGVLLDFQVYCGTKEPDMHGLSSTETIVATLMENYLQSGRCVFLDNYYTSPHLARWLLDRGTYICGTVKPTRKQFPKALAKDQIGKGQSIFYKCDGEDILAVKFRANKDKSTGKPKVVHLLATAHEAATGPTGKKDRENNDVIKPNCVMEYNHQMGGVDLLDQQLHSVHACRKSYKWPKKVATHLIMQACLSANKLYNFHLSKNMPFLSYLHDLIASLLTCSPKLKCLPLRTETVHRLTGRHFPVTRSVQEGGGRKKTKKCRVCYARGIRTATNRPLEVTFVCKTCPSHPGLHVDRDCFETYHTYLDYSKIVHGPEQNF